MPSNLLQDSSWGCQQAFAISCEEPRVLVRTILRHNCYTRPHFYTQLLLPPTLALASDSHAVPPAAEVNSHPTHAPLRPASSRCLKREQCHLLYRPLPLALHPGVVPHLLRGELVLIRLQKVCTELEGRAAAAHRCRGQGRVTGQREWPDEHTQRLHHPVAHASEGVQPRRDPRHPQSTRELSAEVPAVLAQRVVPRSRPPRSQLLQDLHDFVRRARGVPQWQTFSKRSLPTLADLSHVHAGASRRPPIRPLQPVDLDSDVIRPAKANQPRGVVDCPRAAQVVDGQGHLGRGCTINRCHA
mmetsp:Transcript_59766/g.134435  ORF Transcript_59766/g.134435 Transcript_59766/m.134435 type:complete len:300 (-) Transcript_59766:55-954(-)